MRKLIFIIILSIIPLIVSAQFLTKSELGIIAGGGNYIGDINPKYNFYNTNMMLGLIYRYNFNPRWVFKGSFMHGKIGAEDSYHKNIRNLSFESKINEIAATCEFNFFDYQTGSRQHRITPYIFGGIGVFFMNPKALIKSPSSSNSILVELQPLSTEGQGLSGYSSPYSLTQISFPFGLGLKISVSNKICIGMEWGLRMTLTDYIDDVSRDYVAPSKLLNWAGELSVIAADRTNEIIADSYNPPGSMRGNPKTNDWYQFFGLTITAKLNIFQKNKCIAF